MNCGGPKSSGSVAFCEPRGKVFHVGACKETLIVRNTLVVLVTDLLFNLGDCLIPSGDPYYRFIVSTWRVREAY